MVVRHDLMLMCDILMSCALAHISLASAFLLRCTYEPCVFISYCTPLIYLDAGW